MGSVDSVGLDSFTAKGTYCLVRDDVSVNCKRKMGLGQQTTGQGMKKSVKRSRRDGGDR